MTPSDQTIVAELTPPGAGAIAVVALRGAEAWKIVHKLFMPASGQSLPPEMPSCGKIQFGRIGAGGVADEVVLAIRGVSTKKWIELQGHGGRASVEWLLELVQEQGATGVPWTEFLARLEPRWRVLAAERLSRARTQRTAAILLEQYNGEFESALVRIRSALEAGDGAAAVQRIDDVLQFERIGRHLVEPWRVVIAGPPNVGKSSLLNALAGFERSIVSPTPGATRDVVTMETALDGWPIELSDTAGLREQATGFEQAGGILALEQIRQADLSVWLLDAASPNPVWPSKDIARESMLLAINKYDLAPAWDLDSARASVQISALTGAGLEALCRCIVDRLIPAPPTAGAAVPFHPECSAYLRRLRTLVIRNEFLQALEEMRDPVS